MKIVKQSAETLTPVQIYNLVKSPASVGMKNALGSRVGLSCWAQYEDVDKDGNPVTLLSIQADTGELFTTNSATFQREFVDMIDMFAQFGQEVKAINVIGGKTKAGRDYVTCTYAE